MDRAYSANCKKYEIPIKGHKGDKGFKGDKGLKNTFAPFVAF